MSISVDYFFNHENELEPLSRKVGGCLGCFLSPYEGNPQDLFSRYLGMELDLERHSLENDRQLNIQDYRYRIGIRTPVPDWEMRIIQVPAIVLIAYTLFYRLNIKGMLVYDVQHLLARYEERLDFKGSGGEEMFDSVSGEFVSLPRHFKNLDDRLRRLLYEAQAEE